MKSISRAGFTLRRILAAPRIPEPAVSEPAGNWIEFGELPEGGRFLHMSGWYVREGGWGLDENDEAVRFGVGTLVWIPEEENATL